MIDLLAEVAQLAQASYASLSPGLTINSQANLAAQGLTLSQRENFIARYPAIVTQHNDFTAQSGMGTGFNATVFMDTAGQLMLAIRGTDELFSNDRVTDSDIAASGAGYDQIVAMVNWWARVSAPVNQMVNQYRLVEIPKNLVTADVVVLRESIAETAYVLDVAQQAAGLELVAADAVVNVTGHSLGGGTWRWHSRQSSPAKRGK